MTVDKAHFFRIMGAFPSGITIVTSLDAAGRPCGFTSSAISSVSADPPLLLVCVDKNSRTLPALLHTRKFVVNFIREGRDDLSTRFASKSADKFVGVSWRATNNGVPCLYADTLAHAECTLVREIEVGDHLILIGHVEAGDVSDPEAQPLMYFRRSYRSWPAISDNWQLDTPRMSGQPASLGTR